MVVDVLVDIVSAGCVAELVRAVLPVTMGPAIPIVPVSPVDQISPPVEAAAETLPSIADRTVRKSPAEAVSAAFGGIVSIGAETRFDN